MEIANKVVLFYVPSSIIKKLEQLVREFAWFEGGVFKAALVFVRKLLESDALAHDVQVKV